MTYKYFLICSQQAEEDSLLRGNRTYGIEPLVITRLLWDRFVYIYRFLPIFAKISTIEEMDFFKVSFFLNVQKYQYFKEKDIVLIV